MNKIANLNASLANMSRNELESEIINLKHINTAQSEKIDNYEQKIYELKRQLSTARAMEEHLSSEIDSLQRNDRSSNDELLQKISALEDETLNLKQSNAESVQLYELQLQTKNDELKNIIEDLKSKPDVTMHSNTDEINKYTDEICDLKFQIEELNQQLLECENKCQEISLRHNSLENHITELTSQLNEVKDCLQAKREELTESKELARNLQDDMLIMQMEIDKYKSLPMETASKGNSLFAEVDDNRVKLQRTVESMKKNYLDMKTQYSSKCHELQKLHMEYAALMKIIEDKNDASQEKSDLEQTYERHFERLKEQVQSLENELKVQTHATSKLVAKDWKCVQDMISVNREEVQSLQRKLNSESLSVITSESNHYKTKRELKRWQAECMQLRAQIVSLNQTIDELKLQMSPSTESIILKKSCLKNKPLAPITKIDDWDLYEEKVADFSLFTTKFNDTTQTQDSSFTINSDNSIFDLIPPSNEINLMDELNPSKFDSEESDKENISQENISSVSAPNDTMTFLTSKMKKTQDSSFTINSDNSIFDLIPPSNKINLMDELNPSKFESEESDKENISKENISSVSTPDDTMTFLTSKMKKVTFEETTVEPQKTTKLRGIKVIKAQPIYIPSIKRN